MIAKYSQSVVHNITGRCLECGALHVARSDAPPAPAVLRINGRLAIDRHAAYATIDGQPLWRHGPCYPLHRLLLALAERHGQVLYWPDAIEAVTGVRDTTGRYNANRHHLHVTTHRLRQSLRQHAGWLTTDPRRGLTLRVPGTAQQALETLDALQTAVESAVETLRTIERDRKRPGPLADDGYARIETSVAIVRALPAVLEQLAALLRSQAPAAAPDAGLAPSATGGAAPPPSR